ncbi:MAG TPA: uracil-DNA glycosylase family protein [Treponema sp.]|nr:uracil-DNA glycosylase family protein [Treponema sp.]
MTKDKTYQKKLDAIHADIVHDPANKEFYDKGWEPLYFISPQTRIVIIGQAPGLKAQERKIAWEDVSGDRLRQWLNVSKETFYDSKLFGIIPMDFYYPGKGKSGDLPPRIEFAEKWHTQIFENTPNIVLTILIGQYAQKQYLKDTRKKNTTETVRAFASYLPTYLPLVHPSPRNRIWLAKNPWFETDVIPLLQEWVRKIIL